MLTGLLLGIGGGTGRSEDAVVEIVTLEATSLNDGDLEQMGTELFVILAAPLRGGFGKRPRRVKHLGAQRPGTLPCV